MSCIILPYNCYSKKQHDSKLTFTIASTPSESDHGSLISMYLITIQWEVFTCLHQDYSKYNTEINTTQSKGIKQQWREQGLNLDLKHWPMDNRLSTMTYFNCTYQELLSREKSITCLLKSHLNWYNCLLQVTEFIPALHWYTKLLKGWITQCRNLIRSSMWNKWLRYSICWIQWAINMHWGFNEIRFWFNEISFCFILITVEQKWYSKIRKQNPSCYCCVHEYAPQWVLSVQLNCLESSQLSTCCGWVNTLYIRPLLSPQWCAVCCK